MESFSKELIFKTKDRYELLGITDEVIGVVKESGAEDGLVLIYAPHSTAAVLITENESGLKQDFLAVFREMVKGFDFKHDRIDNNTDSHILSGLVGQSKCLPVKEGEIDLGTWQQIFLADFDGPRSRMVRIQILN